MAKVLEGNYIVKRKLMENGEEILQVTGYFKPKDFTLDEIGMYDEELWMSDVYLSVDGIRCTGKKENSENDLDVSNWKIIIPL